jgi:hypothetical protein
VTIGLLIIAFTGICKLASGDERLFMISLSVTIPRGLLLLDSSTTTTHPTLLSFIILHPVNNGPSNLIVFRFLDIQLEIEIDSSIIIVKDKAILIIILSSLFYFINAIDRSFYSFASFLNSIVVILNLGRAVIIFSYNYTILQKLSKKLLLFLLVVIVLILVNNFCEET